MLEKSQPIDPEAVEKLVKRGIITLPDEDEEKEIISQRMGSLFDFIDKKRKISVSTRIKWFFRRHFKDRYYDIKHIFRNHIKWHDTLKELRSWNGDQMVLCMITQLNDYISTEEKYGIAEKSYQAVKLATARETVTILKRMIDPIDYCTRRRDEVEARYPKYVSLISEYKDGGSCHSGDFVQQGEGWTGIEAGCDPREGYFEKKGLLYELVVSPDQHETDLLLEQIRQYRSDISEAYKQAEADSDADFDRLAKLLKKHLYSWWD